MIGDEIEAKLRQFAALAQRDGELWRAPFTVEDERSCVLLEEWLRAAGLTPRRDAVGNLLGRLPGREKGVVMAGSHRDSVKNGGCYDGAAGVITALLAAGELYRELGQPRKTVEVAALQEEEGSRFLSSYIGSKAMTGLLSQRELELTDQEGLSLSQALGGADPAQARRDDIELYLELHVEQGPLLEQQGLPLGVVERIVGLTAARVTVNGRQNHAGTTPMALRLDPMAAAAEMISRLLRGVGHISDSATMTIGEIAAFPGVSNVIPERVIFSVDFRDGAADKLAALDALLQSCAAEQLQRGFGVQVQYLCQEQPAVLDPAAVELLCASAESLDLPYRRMNSGAGHDAQVMASRFPAGMLFIPSKNGVSHTPEEYTSPQQLETGFFVLKQALRTAAWS